MTAVATEARSADAGMLVTRDVGIEMPDGVVLRADVFRPKQAGRYPVLLSHGPYAKDLPFQQGFPTQWQSMITQFPEIAQGSSNRFQCFEVCDPEKWVPHGYVVVRVDSRGAARSPGRIDCFGPQETDDFYECIEWAGIQSWSNGKVGLSGVSYYAINQWLVAARKPPHLAAICPWEGAADWYRDANCHGGIPSPFIGRWYSAQVQSVQHGLGHRGPRNQETGVWISGDETLTDDELSARRADIMDEQRTHPADDTYWRERSADLAEIEVPVLSCGNWGGQGLHLRGNIEGFTNAASEHKWLELHGHAHWAVFYTDYAIDLQRRFFDRYLKGEGDWDGSQPRVQLQVRHPGEYFEQRAESTWPLASTQWQTLYLDAATTSLTADVPAPESVGYQAFGPGVRFDGAPFTELTEITGPLSATLWISNTTADTDIFLVLHLLDPDGHEVRFHGATEPRQSISQGWLRASHRELDAEKSLPYRPFHTHVNPQPIDPGEIYRLDIEIWPTCIVAPAGHRLALTVLGRDWDHGGVGTPSHLGHDLRGSGLNTHDDPITRPADVYDSTVSIHTGPQTPSQLLVPVIPQRP
ncbi:MAG: CocE/NonD family hydrolase [Mycobacterium sp.]